MHEFYDFLHMSGVALFFGGIIISLLVLFFAERRRIKDALHLGVRRARWINAFITVPGVVLITMSGIFQMSYTKGIASESWLVVGLLLFLLAVVVLFAFFIPAQKKLLRDIGSAGEVLTDGFFITLHRVYVFGVIIIILPLGTMALSIMKPQLW